MLPHESSFTIMSAASAAAASPSSSSSSSSSWSWEQDKLFETALVSYPEQTPFRWENIAALFPGKSTADVQKHYEILVHDVMAIEAGLVDVPDYSDDIESVSDRDSDQFRQIDFGSKPKAAETERKRGTPWTEEEHKLFLMGLQKYGKGDWRSISRNAVISRTPTQVASHAQKYFNRLKSDKKEKKRSSIHDIVLPENEGSVAAAVPLNSDPHFGLNNQTGVAPQNILFQQASFSNQGGSAGYQNFGGFTM